MSDDEMHSAFAVDIARLSDSTLMSFSGELDIATAAGMSQSFFDSKVTSARTIQVDLAEVTFLDSTCVGLLIAACKRTRATNGIFFVSCKEGNVRRMLEFYGLIEYLQIEQSL